MKQDDCYLAAAFSKGHRGVWTICPYLCNVNKKASMVRGQLASELACFSIRLEERKREKIQAYFACSFFSPFSFLVWVKMCTSSASRFTVCMWRELQPIFIPCIGLLSLSASRLSGLCGSDSIAHQNIRFCAKWIKGLCDCSSTNPLTKRTHQTFCS